MSTPKPSLRGLAGLCENTRNPYQEPATVVLSLRIGKKEREAFRVESQKWGLTVSAWLRAGGWTLVRRSEMLDDAAAKMNIAFALMTDDPERAKALHAEALAVIEATW